MRSSNWPRYFVPGDHQGQIERDHSLVAQQLRHIAARDLLRQSFGDRGLAHAGFADQHRIILGPPAKHLNDALDFVVPADHRIELAFLGQFSQIATKRAQRRRLDILLRCRLAAFLLGLPAA